MLSVRCWTFVGFVEFIESVGFIGLKGKGSRTKNRCSIAVGKPKQMPFCNSSFPWSLDILSEA